MKVINLIGDVGWEIDEVETIREIQNSTGDLVFFMSSFGGYVKVGAGILNAIRSYDKGETIARISYAASMMTQIAMACDRIEVFDNATFMIHNVQNVAIGDYRELERVASISKRSTNNLASIYAKRSGQELDDILDMMNNDTYLYGAEIVDAGFADSVIETNDTTLDKQTAIAQAKDGFKASLVKAKEEKISADELEAAYKSCYGDTCQCNTADTSVENPSASAGKTESKKEEAKMGPKNPQADNGAEAQPAEAIQTAKAAEKTRVTEIMALGGSAEFTQKAIEDDMSVGEAAIALIKEQREQGTTEQAIFENAANEVASVQTQEAPSQEDEAKAAEDKAWDDAVASKYPKKG